MNGGKLHDIYNWIGNKKTEGATYVRDTSVPKHQGDQVVGKGVWGPWSNVQQYHCRLYVYHKNTVREKTRTICNTNYLPPPFSGGPSDSRLGNTKRRIIVHKQVSYFLTHEYYSSIPFNRDGIIGHNVNLLCLLRVGRDSWVTLTVNTLSSSILSPKVKSTRDFRRPGFPPRTPTST